MRKFDKLFQLVEDASDFYKKLRYFKDKGAWIKYGDDDVSIVYKGREQHVFDKIQYFVEKYNGRRIRSYYWIVNKPRRSYY
jgi:transposase InsO family protein